MLDVPRFVDASIVKTVVGQHHRYSPKLEADSKKPVRMNQGRQVTPCTQRTRVSAESPQTRASKHLYMLPALYASPNLA